MHDDGRLGEEWPGKRMPFLEPLGRSECHDMMIDAFPLDAQEIVCPLREPRLAECIGIDCHIAA